MGNDNNNDNYNGNDNENNSDNDHDYCYHDGDDDNDNDYDKRRVFGRKKCSNHYPDDCFGGFSIQMSSCRLWYSCNTIASICCITSGRVGAINTMILSGNHR